MPVTTETRTPPERLTSSPMKRSRLRLGLRFAGIALALLALIAVTWPQAFGLNRAFGFAQIIAFRPALVLGFGVLAVTAGGTALMMKHRARRIVAFVVAAVFLVAALAQTAVLGARGWGNAFASSDDASALAEGDLVVLSWNAQGGATSAQTIAELALTVRPDVIALPETDAVAAGEIRAILADHGLQMSSSTVGDWIPTSVLISTELGDYRLDASAGSAPGLPSGVWIPDNDTSPPIVVAHPMPPLPASMDDWRTGLDWVGKQCRSWGADVVIAGDLNATVDHFDALPGCSDAGAASSQAASGTWPSTTAQALASPIDHVLIGTDWTVLDFQVIETFGVGSDHRPIVAVLGT